MDRRLLKNLDYTVLVVVGLLVIVGLLMVYSATNDKTQLTGGDPFYVVKKQLVAVVIGLIVMVIILSFDYRISDRMAQLLYGSNIIILVMVLVFGTVRNGAKSWLFGVQPSEFSKVLMIVLFGKYLAEKESLRSFYDFIGPFFYMGVPLFLIMLQPDLGTGLVFIFFMFIMMYMAGAPGKKLLVVVLAGILSVALMFLGNKYLGIPMPIKEYQVNRLTSFINPEKDPHGSGWNVIQAVIAVGSGQFSGKGLFQGTQGRLGYLPENHTDFIFAVLCEELGFVGGFGVLFLFFTFIWRGLRIAFQARDKTGSLIAVGIISMFLFHVLENVGMNIGIMPITGIPLPFISSGGSSMIASLVAVGVLSNIWARRQKIMF
ncbi:MAG TPA: rod shape-determining protein RodA [Bacillota bacterium]|nr:rod shape-determining protein RodA [Bacillota bacterium]